MFWITKIFFLFIFFSNAVAIQLNSIQTISNFTPILKLVDDMVFNGGDKAKFRTILFIFSLRQTIVVHEDICLRHFFKENFNLLLDSARKKFKPKCDIKMLKSMIEKQAAVQPSEEHIADLLDMLQTDEFRAIAISDIETGKFGVFPKHEDFILKQLERFGIRFGPLCASFRQVNDEFSGLEEKSLLKEGVLFIKNQNTATAILNFLNVVHQKINWVPNGIVFINDSYNEIVALKKEIQLLSEKLEHKINFLGFHFQSPFFAPSNVNIPVVNIQLEKFFESGQWINKTCAKNLLTKTVNKQKENMPLFKKLRLFF